MGRTPYLLVAVLLLLVSCKGKSDAVSAGSGSEDAEISTGEPTPEIEVAEPEWFEIWAMLGVTVDVGAVERIDGKFLRVAQTGGEPGVLMAHYADQVTRTGWVVAETDETENHLRTDLTRDHLMLTLIAQAQEGGAFIGLSVHQDWRAMGWPLVGASQTVAEANRFHATYLEGTTSPAVAQEIGTFLTGALGWTRDRDEPMEAPESIVDPLATWYLHGRRTIRVQTHAQTDGIVQLTMRADWR